MTMHVHNGAGWQQVNGLWVHNGSAFEPVLTADVFNGTTWQEFYSAAAVPSCLTHDRVAAEVACPSPSAQVSYRCWGTVADWDAVNYKLDIYYRAATAGGVCSGTYYLLAGDVTVDGSGQWGGATGGTYWEMTVDVGADLGGADVTEWWQSDARIIRRSDSVQVDNLVCACLTIDYRYCP